MSLAYEESEYTPEEACEKLQRIVEGAVKRKSINPWCGICNSHDLHYEDGITKFNSMKEARPHLVKCSVDQLLTRQQIESSRN